MKDFTLLQIKHYVVFLVANEKFAIDIRDVESIHTSSSTNTFDVIEDLKTAVHLHKRVIPIINMRERLRLKGAEPLKPALLFVKHTEENSTSLIGLQIDQTLEIVEVMVAKKPHGKTPRLIKAIVGVTPEVIMVLRIKDILKDELVVPIESQTLN